MDSGSPISLRRLANGFVILFLILILTLIVSNVGSSVPNQQARQTLSAKLSPQATEANSTAMQIESTQANRKRPELKSAGQSKVKRFRTNLSNVRVTNRVSEIMNSQESISSNSSALLYNSYYNDINNNNSTNQQDDVNNNIVQIDPYPGNSTAQTWTRNVDSINGTVDLSRYGQNGVDRLYGDALLVYLKNFNE